MNNLTFIEVLIFLDCMFAFNFLGCLVQSDEWSYCIYCELGSEGNSFLQELVISTFIGGAFIGSIRSGFLVDKVGFQVDTIPLVLGAIIR